jgi:hypothetical protein
MMLDINADEMVSRLIQSQFFRFTATEDLNRAIENVKCNFTREHYLDSSDDQWYLSGERGYRLYGMERRIYQADAEDLAEGGVCDILQEMIPILVQEGVHVASCQDETEWDEEGEYVYKVIINSQRHPVLDTRNGESSWTAAHKRTIEITNGLLESAGSQERLFGQASGNEAALILLTEDLFRYIRTLPLHALCIPFRAEDITLEAES